MGSVSEKKIVPFSRKLERLPWLQARRFEKRIVFIDAIRLSFDT
jgi:hypothetical protein